jgi:hypothetical protein
LLRRQLQPLVCSRDRPAVPRTTFALWCGAYRDSPAQKVGNPPQGIEHDIAAGGCVCCRQRRRSPAAFCAAVKYGQSIPALATDLPLPAVAEVMPRLAALSLGGMPFRAAAGDECARSRAPLEQAAVERLRCHYPAIRDTASQNPAEDPAGAGDSEFVAVALWEPLRRTRWAAVLRVREPHGP